MTFYQKNDEEYFKKLNIPERQHQKLYGLVIFAEFDLRKDVYHLEEWLIYNQRLGI